MAHAFVGERLNSEGTPLMCETCGEAEQSTKLAEAGLCDDCFAATVREQLQEILGYKPCGFPVWVNGNPAICVEVYGEPHAH